MRTFLPAALAASTMLLFGCMTAPSRYDVEMNGLARSDPGAVDHRYLLLPSDSSVSLNDLEFTEYARYVDHALGKAGYQKASEVDDATEAIFLYCGIGNPQEHTYTFWLPDSDQPESSSLTPPDNIRAYGTWGTRTSQDHGNCRYISLSAVDLVKYKEDQQVVELWRMEITSLGSSHDLRRVFPAMIAASEKHLGRNTGRILDRTVTDQDQDVVEIRAVNAP